jgi:hypothetical protein
MIRTKKGISCETIGELKKAIALFPDDTKLTGPLGKPYVVEVWKLTKDSDPSSYKDEKSDAKDVGRKPNFIRVSILEDEF